MKNTAFDWNDLKFFLSTARHGGLSGAAVALDSSPSTVSRHIASLEKSLGTTLFVRHQTGYMLTDDGSALFERTEQVEQAIMATERSAAQAAQQSISGQVRLATTEMLAVHLIAPHLAQFHARYPNLQVELLVALARVNLTRREADLALRVVPPSRDDGAADYVASRVGSLQFAMYESASMPPAAASSRSKPSPVERWRKMPYVSWDESAAGLPLAKWLAAAFDGRQPLFSCNSMQVQHAAIRGGLGVGLLPCFVADRDPGVRRVPVSIPLPSNELWLVYHRDLKGSQRVIALRDFIRQVADSSLVQA